MPALHRPHPRKQIVRNIPRVEKTPPPLLAPSASLLQQSRGKDLGLPRRQIPENVSVKAPPKPAGETYGTQVMFHSNQAEAAELAQQKHKLLFVMHISGNFEDSCFT